MWCSHPDRYYDAASATCKECGNVERYALKQLAVLLAIIIFLALLRLASIRMPRLLARVSGRLAQFDLRTAPRASDQVSCATLKTCVPPHSHG